VKIPVLLVQGEQDRWTPPWHSKSIMEALQGRKQLLMFEGGHDDVIRIPKVWDEIVQFITTV
jgi:pimeloyl-ACP methyl ester carboxylesterase